MSTYYIWQVEHRGIVPCDLRQDMLGISLLLELSLLYTCATFTQSPLPSQTSDYFSNSQSNHLAIPNRMRVLYLFQCFDIVHAYHSRMLCSIGTLRLHALCVLCVLCKLCTVLPQILYRNVNYLLSCRCDYFLSLFALPVFVHAHTTPCMEVMQHTGMHAFKPCAHFSFYCVLHTLLLVS